MPDALSIAPSKNESVCAITAMFSSVVPGSTPHTLAVLRPFLISTVRRMRSLGDCRRSIISRTAAPSSLPSIITGIFAGSVAPPVGWLVTLPGNPRMMNKAAAPASSASGNFPRRGKPLRRKLVELLNTDLVEPDAAELRGDPLRGHPIVRRAGDAAPVLIPVVAALARDGGDLVDVSLDARPAQARVPLLGRRQRPPQILLVRQPERRLRRTRPFASAGCGLGA